MRLVDTTNFGQKLLDAVGKFSSNVRQLQTRQQGEVSSAMQVNNIKTLVAQCPYAADLMQRAISLETQGRVMLAKAQRPSNSSSVPGGATAMVATQRAEMENKANQQIDAAKALLDEIRQLAKLPASVCLQRSSDVPANTAQPALPEESFGERYQWPIVVGLGLAATIGLVIYIRSR